VRDPHEAHDALQTVGAPVHLDEAQQDLHRRLGLARPLERVGEHPPLLEKRGVQIEDAPQEGDRLGTLLVDVEAGEEARHRRVEAALRLDPFIARHKRRRPP
jgi:hypothetical protein